MVWLVGGCSLVADFGDECTTSGDCAGELVCTSKLCVQAGAGGDAGSTVDGGGPSGPLQLTAECDLLRGATLEELRRDDVIVLGMLMPESGALAEVGPPIEDAAFLAQDEINQSGGLLGRRFVLAVCDTGTDAAQATRAAKWLVEQARVPAIIGPAASSATLQVANTVTVPGGVVIVSPSSTSPALTDLRDQDLVWRTAPSDAIQGAAIAAHLLAGGYGKVAVVNRDDTYGNGLRDAIQRTLCAADRCGEGDYYTRSYAEDSVEDQSRILFELQTFEPDVVVLIAFVTDGIRFLSLAGAAGLDRFILTDGTKDALLLDEVEHEGLLRSLIGTAPASPSGELYEQFALGYRNKWRRDPGVFNAQAYDAMYLLAYAAAGVPEGQPLTGEAMAHGLRRLSAGEAIAAGAGRWNRGVAVLRGDAAATIDFDGASGPLDFGREGEATGDIEGWRFDVDAGRVRTLGVLYTADGVYTAPPTPETEGKR